MSNLISAPELLDRIIHPSLVIADCRYDLADTGLGARLFHEGHIPGSVHVPLDGPLSDAPGSQGGRHPLPSIARLEAVMSGLGITRGETDVVCLDDQGNPFAARLWWILRHLGHDRVRVLDGGMRAWREAGGPVTQEVTPPSPARFVADPRPWMLASREDVRNRHATPLIDSRAADRFRGENETIDPVAGHIPGARNLPWMECVDDGNRFLPVERLHARYAGLDGDAIFYCGSGVTASVIVLAMDEAGLGMPRLYAGGWSDWIQGM